MKHRENEWAVTIKIQKTDRIYLACDYDKYVHILMNKQREEGRNFYIKEAIYEMDSKKKLHYHAIWELMDAKLPYYKAFNVQDCSCNIKSIYYRTGWEKYIKKDQIKK